MESGEYQIGTDESKNNTGKGIAVRIIKIKNVIKAKEEFEDDKEEELFYGLSAKNHKIYKVEERNFARPNFDDDRVNKFESETETKYHSYIGYDFGEVIPTEASGYKNMIEEIIGEEPSDEDFEAALSSGVLVFLGTEKEEEDDEEDSLVRLCWLEKEDDDGEVQNEILLPKNDFVKFMLIPMEQPKKFTVHYINTDGVKTKMAVNVKTEITDLKEELYTMEN